LILERAKEYSIAHTINNIMSNDWIDNIISAWTGHRKFAEWLVHTVKPTTIVELGVDYGFSTFVFGNALQNSSGTIYGIDLFQGDIHTGFRDTSSSVTDKITEHNLTNIKIIKGEFTEVSKTWTTPIDILHIDGLHTFEAVKTDFLTWAPFVKNSGIILFHDITAFAEIQHFFRILSGGHKLYFTHSAGLGILTQNEELAHSIIASFNNVNDFAVTPL